MQSLAGSTGILRRHRVVSVFSALHRWWHPALVRGDAPLIYAASALRLEGDPTNSRSVLTLRTFFTSKNAALEPDALGGFFTLSGLNLDFISLLGNLRLNYHA